MLNKFLLDLAWLLIEKLSTNTVDFINEQLAKRKYNARVTAQAEELNDASTEPDFDTGTDNLD